MNWTGLNFAEAWPFIAAAYGLFALLLLIGFGSVWWQGRALKRRAAQVAALQAQLT